LDDIRPLRKLAKAQSSKFFMSVPPTAINLSIKNSPYEWSTWGMWDAPNKPTGMAISIYSTDTVKKAKVQIKDAMDSVIRNLNVKLDSSGFNRSYWGFEQKEHQNLVAVDLAEEWQKVQLMQALQKRENSQAEMYCLVNTR
jgi:hypothetical protein